MQVSFAVLPAGAATRVMLAVAVGTWCAGIYGKSVLGGVMGDFLGATICVIEV
jgi:cobalamin synthase